MAPARISSGFALSGVASGIRPGFAGSGWFVCHLEQRPADVCGADIDVQDVYLMTGLARADTGSRGDYGGSSMWDAAAGRWR